MLQWLRALPSSRQSFNVVFGECPYCSKVSWVWLIDTCHYWLAPSQRVLGHVCSTRLLRLSIIFLKKMLNWSITWTSTSIIGTHYMLAIISEWHCGFMLFSLQPITVKMPTWRILSTTHRGTTTPRKPPCLSSAWARSAYTREAAVANSSDDVIPIVKLVIINMTYSLMSLWRALLKQFTAVAGQ